MAITLDPTVPADAESPRLGASRIRGLTAAIQEMFGGGGVASETFTVAPFTVDTTTGKVQLAGNGTTGLQPVAFQQFAITAAAGASWVKLPGGLLIQWTTTQINSNSSPYLFTFPTAFTSTTSYVAIAQLNSPGPTGPVLTVQQSSSTVLDIFFTGTVTFSVFGIGT